MSSRSSRPHQGVDSYQRSTPWRSARGKSLDTTRDSTPNTIDYLAGSTVLAVGDRHSAELGIRFVGSSRPANPQSVSLRRRNFSHWSTSRKLRCSLGKACVQQAAISRRIQMHAAIGALSSGVPAAAIAYSDQFQGVFEGRGLGHRGLDARRLDGDELADGLVDAFRSIDADAHILLEHLPPIRDTVERQFDAVAATIAYRHSTETGSSWR